MNRLHPAVTLLLLALPVAACSVHWNTDDDGKPGIAASGSGGERHWTVSGFDKVALAASGDVEVRTGGQSYAVTATGDPAALDTLKVTQDGNTLGLGRKQGVHWTGSDKIHWLVMMPRISEANIGGSGTIRVDKVEGTQFQADIGGSGTISIATMNVRQAGFGIGGSGTITAAGKARDVDLSIAGSGKLLANGLVADTASVSIAGAGNVEATVHSKADVTILGSGDVTIAGGAKCSVTKMGAGNVHCG
ncbi:head GIN domain-containing protein [Sphingomonas bacterium]|uniref:head GIN domain-containing protein n=1 Tax=Sphingomonas bacterium TaxID=1895847 RepID=UPI001575D491|nr:head GIN domain-containing protein [Sphingomonas bacterium]